MNIHNPSNSPSISQRNHTSSSSLRPQRAASRRAYPAQKVVAARHFYAAQKAHTQQKNRLKKLKITVEMLNTMDRPSLAKYQGLYPLVETLDGFRMIENFGRISNSIFYESLPFLDAFKMAVLNNLKKNNMATKYNLVIRD